VSQRSCGTTLVRTLVDCWPVKKLTLFERAIKRTLYLTLHVKDAAGPYRASLVENSILMPVVKGI